MIENLQIRQQITLPKKCKDYEFFWEAVRAKKKNAHHSFVHPPFKSKDFIMLYDKLRAETIFLMLIFLKGESTTLPLHKLPLDIGKRSACSSWMWSIGLQVDNIRTVCSNELYVRSNAVQ